MKVSTKCYHQIYVVFLSCSLISFSFFNFFFFTLQYCIGFAIHQHESATGVHVFPILNPLPPPSPYHPSGSSQCTSPKHPVSCIEPGLAIRFLYDIIHVSVSFSQIIPPSPSPTESKDCSIHLKYLTSQTTGPVSRIYSVDRQRVFQTGVFLA